ncbi:MAG TPA: hypothetical protein VF169_20050 [Albitalea sp.]|uniref:hypothetical protein n=1 Tax=Piscinibacter sp. TaxID=1903157 RepID=UPI002ED4F2E5
MKAAALGLLLAATMAQAQVPLSNSGIGINLDAQKYWQSDWPFINELKRAGGWGTSCEPSMPQCRDFAKGGSPNDTKEQDKLELDADGWVKRLPAADDPSVKYRGLFVLLWQGNGGAQAPGRYVVLYDGEGTIGYAGAGRKIAAESRPGRDVLEVVNRPAMGLQIRITRIDENNHLRNLRIIGPGGVCAGAPLVFVGEASRCSPASSFRSLEQLSATQTFHPAFLADLHGMRAMRFMKWNGTETSTLSRWDQRPKPGDAMWSSGNGVPYEAMLELASAAGADPWISVPSRVDDDFLLQFARLAKRSLRPGSALWFEYGNEPWNAAPPWSQAGEFYEQKARAAWPGATQPAWQQRLNWYALRSVQACRIVKREFGNQASRVRCVANGQAANPAMSETVLACELARPLVGDRCSRDFDALAIAPYFGHQIGDPQYKATVDRWPDEPDGGLASLFREITGRDAQGQPADAPMFAESKGRTPRQGSLEQVRGWIRASKQVADKHGLPLVAYEGGQHMIVYRGGKTEAMFRAANRDPRMGQAIEQLLADWKEAGGQLFVAFSYTQQPSRGMFWGMKEQQTDDEAPKWKAIKAWRDRPCWWKACAR